MKKNSKKIKLVEHGGCKNCTKNCIFNSLVTTSEKSKLTENKKFGCNNAKR